MRNRILFLFIVICLILAGCSFPAQKVNQIQDSEIYSVLEIIDGDTFKIMFNGKKEKVRLIGIDSPEVRHPSKGKEPFGSEASAFTKQLLAGQKVSLEFGVQQRDKYGRLLAYVYLPDGRFVNSLLVQEGYAQVMTVPPNVKYQDVFLKLQKEARESKKGLWGL